MSNRAIAHQFTQKNNPVAREELGSYGGILYHLSKSLMNKIFLSFFFFYRINSLVFKRIFVN